MLRVPSSRRESEWGCVLSRPRTMDSLELTTEPAGAGAESDPNNNEPEKEEQEAGDSGDEVPEADRRASGSPTHRDAGGDSAASSRAEPVQDVGALAEVKAAGPLKVNPYSVIDITPFQGELGPSPEPASPEEGSVAVPSGYSVPVPCGYAVPCSLPALVPAYSSPVLVCPVSGDDQEALEGAANGQLESLSSEDPANSDDRGPQEDSVLAQWVSDPANTAWIDNAEEAIYDDVPRENSDSEPEDMVYDDVENGDGGGNSSLEYGWSSSEFESYEEQSDSEGRTGVPRSFLRSSHRKQMQKLVKAAKEGTKDGLERTKAAVRKGRSFIRSHSLMPQEPRDDPDEELSPFIDVDCQHPEAVLTPMPEGLSQQQVVRRYILGAIVDSEKNYVEALQRILESYEKPLLQMEPRVLSERKLKVVFYRVKEVLQCHSLFQIALASRVAEWDSVEMIGDVFVASFSKSMVLDAYSEYVNNFSSAVAVLKKTCATKPAFLQFLKQSQETSPDRTTLYSLMTKPIQRFPQFILLLQDMLRHTSPGHPDRLPLQMALTELETLAEKLNERKRDADQRCEMKRIAKAANERYLNKLLSTGSRYLVRSDDMIETVYGDRGQMLKTKERRLFMLNDVLMCATVSTRSQDGGTATSPGHRYLLKWSVPLGLVEPVECGSSEGAGERGRGPPGDACESLVLAARPGGATLGPDQLHQDLQNLLHDLAVLGQICQLVGTLRGHYQNLNASVAQDWTSGLQRLILQKEADIRAAACCRLQLQLPGKPDKSGRPTFFSAVFNTLSPAAKESWLHSLRTAKLGLEEDNSLGWFCVEDDGNQMRKERHPLLVGHVPVTVAKQQEFKIECAAYNPEPLPPGENQPDLPHTGLGFLWVGSCTGQMGQVAIISFQSSTPKVVECFNVESRILSMVYVPESEATAACPATVPTICLGTEEGSIHTYKSRQGAKKVRLQLFFTPNKSSVLALACSPGCLYAGLVNGTVVIYARAEDGTWDPKPQTVVELGVLPARALLLTDNTLWVACGGQVALISLDMGTLESQLEAHQEEGMVVSHMAVAGVGIWVAFTSGCTLRLFHTETLQHLQDINVATPIHHMLPGQQHLCVTCLLVCHGLLMVGTSLGFVVALPVPRLQGIPKVTGRGMVSYHAHSGPVKFLIAVSATVKDSQHRRDYLPPNSRGDEQQEMPPEGPGAPLGPSSADAAVWPGGSTPLRNDFSSSSGSLTLSQGSGSLDLRLEDGALGDLLVQPPGVPGGVRRGRRVRNSTVMLVACGGQGHRRLSRRARQQRPEELGSSLMVWQLRC
ncbi:rho guanine nucleotide exchange factor 10 isoform X1 [Suncus etruscus]|uniref:rho guanine nucleotide exchange factor 10 isoform X1 n=1 Tax=Suncus etruscus TaxID=109475 RepID=UPI00210F636D|nr:rho guanine nucleotide exchange factor 10 isoform X1 [Suncus etruscus]